MAYWLSWVVYLAAAAGLVGFSYWYIENMLPRTWALLLRVLLIVVLLTPWFVNGSTGYQIAPAVIAVWFNILAHSGLEALKALLPILFVGTVSVGVLMFAYKPEADE